MMETPVCDFVRAYAAGPALRLHMPGHKGTPFLGMEALDITEIDGADVLYKSDGIIRRSEENAAALFGTARTVYSAEGSSLSIRAMLYLLRMYGAASGKPPLIAAGRNAHTVFMTAAALLDLDIAWIFPGKQEGIVSCEITADALDRFLAAMEEKPIAVYITSPDYLGNQADIRQLAWVCRNHGVLLAVDNAHGAYLRFLPEPCHPIALGADLCCDSAHKTLPVLTGGGYLHIADTAPALFREQAEAAMALFASTSPSYLILQSLDMANRYLSEGYRERLASCSERIAALKGRLSSAGYTLTGTEPLKITIAAKPYGYTGAELARQLSARNIVCEFYDPDRAVMMLTPESGDDALSRLEKALLEIPARPAILEQAPPMSRPVKGLSPREALLSPGRVLPARECRGRILSSASVSCPPAIPIVVCGEVIDEAAIRLLDYYGIQSCRVLDGPPPLPPAE